MSPAMAEAGKDVDVANSQVAPTGKDVNIESSPVVEADKVGDMGFDAQMDQKRRLQQLKDKVIVFIGAGFSPSKRSIFEKALEHGVKSVVMDGPMSWATAMVADGTITKLYEANFGADMKETVAEMLQIAKKIEVEVGPISGVCSFFEVAVPVATRFAEALGVPHNSPLAVDNARDKHETRRVTEEAGLAGIRHASVYSDSDLSPASEKVGFPAVLKATSLFQSMGVLRVDNFAELKAAHAKILAEIERVKEEVQDTADYRATVGEMSSKMILEEFMDGDEQVVDLVFSEGECVYSAVTDNWPATRSFEPKFNETGSNSPSVLTADQQTELCDLSIGVTKALGFSVGVFCVNAKYTSRGARLIEVNCRMGGMFVRDHNKLCWGVDLVEEHLLATAGIPCRPPKALAPLQFTGGVYPSVEMSGVVENANAIQEYLPSKREDMVYMTPLIEPGEAVLGPKDAIEFPTWICGYMCTAPNVKEAIEKAQKINDDIVARVVIKPVSDDDLQMITQVGVQDRQQTTDSVLSVAVPSRQTSWAT